MKFRIGALALDRAGVENLIARLEQRHLGSDRIDDAGRVIAQDLEFAFRQGGALADLVVDGIGGDRLDGDADVAALRFGLGGLEIDQGFERLDGQRLLVSDGLHRAVLPLKIQVLSVYQIGGTGQLQAFAGRRYFCLFEAELPAPEAVQKGAYLLLIAGLAPYI